MKEDFLFSSAQRRGVILLLLLSFFYISYLYLRNNCSQTLEPIEIIESQWLPKVKIIVPVQRNPNYWKIKDWELLGFSKKQIQLIKNYKSKLKNFNSKEQLYNCYAFSEKNKLLLDSIVKFPKIKTEEVILKSFLLIKSGSIPDYNLNRTFDTIFFQFKKNKYSYYLRNNLENMETLNSLKHENSYSSTVVAVNPKKLKVIISNRKKNRNKFKNITPKLLVSINTSDTISWKKIKGIGSKRAFQIIKYRDLLGGFQNLDQIKEVYSINDSLFDSFKDVLTIKDSTLRCLNINLSTVEELKKHPYINWNIANSIVSYRNQHGQYVSLDDLLKIRILNNEIYLKIVSYLTVK
jgi:competence ComEA-like helix-hairpin-helix protein